MDPIDFFTGLSRTCADRPFVLLHKEKQKKYLVDLENVVKSLKTKLESKKLEKTHGYKIINEMDESLQGEDFDEVKFANALAQLDEIYGPKTDSELLKKVKYMDSFAEKFKKQTDEYYFSEGKIEKVIKDLTSKQIEEHDLKVLNEIGAFYVWEYTLILQQEMEKVDEEGKGKLLESGMQVKAGNLPGLIPLVRTFRQELAFNIYDKKRRWQILIVFYNFQTVLDSGDVDKIMKAFKTFHVHLLTIALQGGYTHFKGVVYKPYPDGTPVQEIIEDLEK